MSEITSRTCKTFSETNPRLLSINQFWVIVAIKKPRKAIKMHEELAIKITGFNSSSFLYIWGSIENEIYCNSINIREEVIEFVSLLMHLICIKLKFQLIQMGLIEQS